MRSLGPNDNPNLITHYFCGDPALLIDEYSPPWQLFTNSDGVKEWRLLNRLFCRTCRDQADNHPWIRAAVAEARNAH
jgi:hypothetical protein